MFYVRYKLKLYICWQLQNKDSCIDNIEVGNASFAIHTLLMFFFWLFTENPIFHGIRRYIHVHNVVLLTTERRNISLINLVLWTYILRITSWHDFKIAAQPRTCEIGWWLLPCVIGESRVKTWPSYNVHN